MASMRVDRDDDAIVLSRWLRLLVERGADVVLCDVAALVADLDAVEILARLRLEAGRLNVNLCFRHITPALARLISDVGLREALLLHCAVA